MFVPLAERAAALLRVGQVTLNLESRAVSVGGRITHLTAKEYSILELLVRHRGTVFSKHMIFDAIYDGSAEPEMKIIDVFICKLRKKLAIAGADNLIGTVWGHGYTINKPMREDHPDGFVEALA